jgi:AcrR family transcriptional regulator
MREKRQQRELEIKHQARLMVEESGFFDMKISELAKRCQLSIGTLYSHYACKEDLLVALALDGEELRLQRVKKAIEMAGTAMEKFLSAGLTCVHSGCQNRSLNEASLLVMCPSVWMRASPHLHQRMLSVKGQVYDLFNNLLLQASDEFTTEIRESDTQIESMHIGVWSLALGIDAISCSNVVEGGLIAEKIDQWKNFYINNLIRLLKGWGWKEENPMAIVNPIFDNLVATFCDNAEQENSDQQNLK